MNKKKAKLKYKNNSFDIIEEGDFVLCAVTGKEIPLQKLIDHLFFHKEG